MPQDKKARVASIFIDESGAKNSKGGFFVVGFIKTYDPSALWREIRTLRHKHRYNDEIKFASISGANKNFYGELTELLASSVNIERLGGSVYDSKLGFSGKVSSWEEQAAMACRLICGNTNKTDLVICFMDLVQTPRNSTTVASFVKGKVNSRLSGNPVLEAYDVDSRSHDIIQLADFVTGCIRLARERSTKEDKTPRDVRKISLKTRISDRLARALYIDSYADIQEGRINILTMQNTREQDQDSED